MQSDYNKHRQIHIPDIMLSDSVVPTPIYYHFGWTPVAIVTAQPTDNAITTQLVSFRSAAI
jgi:hypothetical protein